MDIGFIGLGLMGSGMALNLQKAGHHLIVFDAKRSAAEMYLEAGATWADTPREIAASTSIVLTSLPGPPEVEAVALGENGLLAGIQHGATYVDLSTNSVTTVRKIYDEFLAKGANVLDAPVSGGPKGAASGKLAIWVGGEEAVFKRVTPVLDAISDQLQYVGPIGAGTVAKLVHNGFVYITTAALAEVFTMGVKAGVDSLAIWEAVRNGAVGRRCIFDLVTDQFLRDKYDPPAFALRLAHKDVSLVTALGREFNVPMRLANLALADLTEALNRGWGDRDSRSAMLLQAERAGVSVAADPERLQAALDAINKIA